MNKELFALLKKGKVETDEDFQLFCKYSDEVITDTYTDAEIIDVRIYLLKEKGIFCEIYADVNKGEWEDEICNIASPQDIRYFIDGEDGYSFSNVQAYLRENELLVRDIRHCHIEVNAYDTANKCVSL